MQRRICLAGNPNSGKTTLFNRLCGTREKIGNWAGTTVERKEGRLTIGDETIAAIDLPGTYSLSAHAIDEKVARDFIIEEEPDLVVAVIDSSNLERNLFLVLQLVELEQRVVLDLNMIDVAESLGAKVSSGVLSEMLDLPVVETVAPKGRGVEELKKTIAASLGNAPSKFQLDYGPEAEKAIAGIIAVLGDHPESSPSPCRGIAVKLLEEDEDIVRRVKSAQALEKISEIRTHLAAELRSGHDRDIEAFIVEKKRGYLRGIVREIAPAESSGEERPTLSDKIDNVVTHRFLGVPIFLFFMYLVFQFVFLLGRPLSDVINTFFNFLSENASDVISRTFLPAWVGSLVGEGIIAGVGSVLAFMPTILLLYLGISILEDSGYLARGAFVMDRFMHALGLHGKSFIPMLLGFGCNVAGVMAARTLETRKDRIVTILVNPLMSCAARLPVYTLFAGVFFPRHAALVVFSIYLIGIVLSVIVAKVFKSVFFKGEDAPLVMELPPYRMPDAKSTLWHMWLRGSLFLKKAGTVIVIAVIVVWFLSSIPFGVEYASEDSVIGHIGKAVAPVLEPAGYGSWQAAVALMTGIMAKEVIIGTFGTLYGAEEGSLPTVLPRHFTPLSAYSLMIMVLVYVPCIATIVVIKRETSWRWTLLTVAYTLFLGWLLSVLVYQIGSLFI